MKNVLLLSFLFLFGYHGLLGQVTPLQYTKGDFLAIGGGGTQFKLRDNGTSPLFYDGILASVSLDWTTISDKWYTEGYVSYGYGLLTRAELQTYASTIHSINHGAVFLKEVWQSEKKPIHVKAGASIIGTTNVRFNPDLRNAGSTVESINTLTASGRIEWLFDTNKDKRRFLWIIPMKPGRRVGKLSYQLNLPIVNLIWSPGFSFIDDFTDDSIDYNIRNEFKTGGFRLSSSIGYEYFLLNGNSLRFRYFWDTFSGPEDFGQIEFAQHQLQAALLIRLSELK